MHKKQSIVLVPVFFIICLSFGCVSKGHFLEVEKQHEAEVKGKNDLITDLKDKLTEMENREKACVKDLTNLRVDFKKLENDKYKVSEKSDQLTHQIEDLKLTIKKKESIIKLQDELISQVSETKKKIERSLKDQIAAQEIKIEDMKGKLKVTFIDKILF